MAEVLYLILSTVFCIVCVFMILLILIQKGRGGGLSSAFGGAGGNTAFGSKTGDVLTWVTAVVFLLFVVLSMSLIRTVDVVDAKNNAIAVNGGNTVVAADEAAIEDPADGEVVDDEVLDDEVIEE
jgi:preprotein translocase subunit SecG